MLTACEVAWVIAYIYICTLYSKRVSYIPRSRIKWSDLVVWSCGMTFDACRMLKTEIRGYDLLALGVAWWCKES